MKRLTDPNRTIVPKITDIDSFEYAQVYERLKEIENQMEAAEKLKEKELSVKGNISTNQSLFNEKEIDDAIAKHKKELQMYRRAIEVSLKIRDREMDKTIAEKTQNIEQLSFGEMRKLMKRWIIHHAKYDVELSPGMLDRLLEECKRTYWRQS